MKKFTQEEVFSFFEKENYKMTDIYINCKEKLKYTCPMGHTGEITFDNFKRGKRCPVCRIEESSKRYSLNIEDVKYEFVKRNLVPLFSEYKNSKEKLRYICECGKEWESSLNCIRRGRRCPSCAAIKRMKNRKNGFVVSTQQKMIHGIVGGDLNYVVGTACLDIAFVENKTYIEYDGSGHNLSVILGSKSKEEFEEKEKRRRYALYRRGWKEIRIISKKDRLPNENCILNIFNYGLKLLETGKYCIFDIDNGTVSYGNKTILFNFGELSRIRKS